MPACAAGSHGALSADTGTRIRAFLGESADGGGSDGASLLDGPCHHWFRSAAAALFQDRAGKGPNRAEQEQGVKTHSKGRRTHRENRWVLFNNGCIHGIQHSELVLVRSVPNRS